ncbi:hypothetical protein VP01_3599g1 [Puccinia sorghi]|uniref:Uncharacterized protein n=1 Tax=Puccinia sorghi TaxID=27349 RepID=A0A0L6UV44_9BASI|nr:hypothetical protein VP01_3599g1 [Puccinia sorghi]
MLCFIRMTQRMKRVGPEHLGLKPPKFGPLLHVVFLLVPIRNATPPGSEPIALRLALLKSLSLLILAIISLSAPKTDAFSEPEAILGKLAKSYTLKNALLKRKNSSIFSPSDVYLLYRVIEFGIQKGRWISMAFQWWLISTWTYTQGFLALCQAGIGSFRKKILQHHMNNHGKSPKIYENLITQNYPKKKGLLNPKLMGEKTGYSGKIINTKIMKKCCKTGDIILVTTQIPNEVLGEMTPKNWRSNSQNFILEFVSPKMPASGSHWELEALQNKNGKHEQESELPFCVKPRESHQKNSNVFFFLKFREVVCKWLWRFRNSHILLVRLNALFD